MNYNPNQAKEEAKAGLLEDITLARAGEHIQIYKIDVRNIVPLMAAFGEEHVDSLEDRMAEKIEAMRERLDLYAVYRPKGDVFYVLAEGAANPAEIAQTLQEATTMHPAYPDLSKSKAYNVGTQMARPLDDDLEKGEMAVNPEIVDTSVTWVEAKVPTTVAKQFVDQLTDLLSIYNKIAKRLADNLGEGTPVFGESVENPKKRLAQLVETYGMPVDWDDVLDVRPGYAMPPPLPPRDTTGDALLDAWLIQK